MYWSKQANSPLTPPPTPYHAKPNSAGGLIPDHFFARNEDVFRNAVQPGHPGVRDEYAAVVAAARRLCELVAEVCDRLKALVVIMIMCV